MAYEVEQRLNTVKPIFEVAVFVDDPKVVNGKADLVYKLKQKV